MQVLAFKMAGKGVLSQRVVTRTDEEGTQNDFLVLFVLLLFFFRSNFTIISKLLLMVL